ncbi:hypothetical protein AXA84_0323 [Candidatus Phytoplasma oryzae]|uniref:Transmembrane protein n=1 Tax=Candidatus Phytoplasma oryzae TaxID=203274 RepID=A0A139JQB6_9MOLU|nr:hypothetical protein [Candidatus Phytoplasma oryzae]KXT29171.1 hypothetical protein AXA84_0323 [Candidatus Phytoplasma oryzae]
MNVQQILNQIINSYNNNTLEFCFFCLLIFVVLILIGPIIFFVLFFIKTVFRILYYIFLFNWNFIFGKKPKNKKNNDEIPQISINNQHPNYNEKNLTLIEMKILEINQKENRQSHHNLIKLELNQNKLENKIELNEQKNYFEKKLLEQQIKFLEKEIEKIKNKEINKKQEQEEILKINNLKQKQEYDINLSNIEETEENFSKYNKIPEDLKKIFDKITNLENIQFYILSNIIKNNKSYYDEKKHIFYIIPKDLIFIKSILSKKNEENEKLIN